MSSARILLGYVVLLLCGSSLVWSARDQAAPMWDQSRHAWNALRVAEIVERGAVHEIPAWRDGHYAVAGYVPAALAHVVFGRSYDVATAAMTLFWTPILVLGVFWFARGLLGDELAGALAVAWIASSAMVIDFSKDFLLDLPIAALVALAMALLVRSQFLAERRHSLAFGAASGALLMTKVGMPAVFLVFSLAYAAWRGWREQRLRPFIVNAAIAGALAAAIAGPFYIGGLLALVQKSSEAAGIRETLLAGPVQHGRGEGDPAGAAKSLFFYVRALADIQARGILLAFPLAGIVLLWVRRRRAAILISGSIVLSLAAWVAFPNKDARFTLPLLVFLAAGVAALAPRTDRWRAAAALAAGMLMTANVLAVQWGIGSDRGGYLRGRPLPDPPLAMEILKVLDSADRRDGGKGPVVRLDLGTADSPYLNSWNFHHYRLVLDSRVQLVPTPGAPVHDQPTEFLLIGRNATTAVAPNADARLVRTWRVPRTTAVVDLLVDRTER